MSQKLRSEQMEIPMKIPTIMGKPAKIGISCSSVHANHGVRNSSSMSCLETRHIVGELVEFIHHCLAADREKSCVSSQDPGPTSDILSALHNDAFPCWKL